MSQTVHDTDVPVAGPLSGVRVIDMTTILMGPYATQILGDYGADVVKVEAPQGDLLRQVGANRNRGMGALFLNSNRSKRSITLNLKEPEGRDVLLRLCEKADILIYNVRAKAMERLGLGYKEVSSANPRIIYAGLFGCGQHGPYATRPAYDDLIQGASTIPYFFTRVDDGKPRYVPTATADRVVGLNAVGAVLATLVHRDRTGKGQAVEIPMFETMLSFVLSDHLSGLTYEPPLDKTGYTRLLSPDRRPYETKNGYICALVYTDQQWERFFNLAARHDFPEIDPRFRTFAYRTDNVDAVLSELAEVFLTKTTEEWFALLEDADIPFMPMHDLESVLKDPHLVETDFFSTVQHPTEGAIRSMAVPIQWSSTAAVPTRLAPRQGEHSIEVLLEAGYERKEVASMLERNVIGSPDDAIEQFSSDGEK